MLRWAFVFLLIAIVAGIFGFTGVEATAATIAQMAVRHFPGAVHRRVGDRAGHRRQADVCERMEKSRRRGSRVGRCPG